MGKEELIAENAGWIKDQEVVGVGPKRYLSSTIRWYC
jgi:hypothetical protein